MKAIALIFFLPISLIAQESSVTGPANNNIGSNLANVIVTDQGNAFIDSNHLNDTTNQDSLDPPFTEEKGRPEMKLVWSDEFDYKGSPDAKKWEMVIGNGCPDLCGWGNKELQHYTNELKNARVENGFLVVEGHQTNKADEPYTSARLSTGGKGFWKYGRIEARAQLPGGLGTWPAIWMLPEEWVYGGWPKSGEIDIMEHVGYNPSTVYSTVHTAAFNHLNNTHLTDSLSAPFLEDQFHVFAIDWTPEKIDFSANGEIYFTFNKVSSNSDEWPFDQAFHLVINLAVGGNWGGKMGVDPNIWPQRMLVDYVRVYQKE